MLLSHSLKFFKYTRPKYFFYRFLNLDRSLKGLEISFTDGKKMHIDIKKIARQADGSAIARIGDTNVLVTAVSLKKPLSSATFIPLNVDYRQKSSSAAKIAQTHLRREIVFTEKEILTCRLIDRSLRPLFPEGYYYETQIVSNVLSLDGIFDPDIIAINGASAALYFSDIPWNGPIGSVRIAILGDEYICNPTRREINDSDFQVLVTTTNNKNVIMMEGSANKPILLQNLLKAIKLGIREANIIVESIKNFSKHFSVEKREIEKYFVPKSEYLDSLRILGSVKLTEIFTNYSLDKYTRDKEITLLRQDILTKMQESYPNEDVSLMNAAYIQLCKEIMRDVINETKYRCDGREVDEIRNMYCEVDLYKPLHGSSLFQRGQTQVLCTLVLDSVESAMKLDPISVLTGSVKEKNFMLHYEFPSFSINEISKGPALNRREIGHGALAEKALRPLIPSDFPFTTKLSCDVLESNGSSSMASVCAGSLALLDGGVPIEQLVAGVAVGLMSHLDENQKRQYTLLSDISGIEDYLGEMDLKLAGTKKAVTAFQMDVKLAQGIPMKLISDAFIMGFEAKNRVINVMSEVINEPNEASRSKWPIREEIDIPAHKRAKLIGFGGINLKKLSNDFDISVTQDPDNVNKFIIYSPNMKAHNAGMDFIHKMIVTEDYEKKLEFKAIYPAKITEILDSGVKVILHPEMIPVFLSNRELDVKLINHASALGLRVGDEINVKYFGRDPVTGAMRLSRRAIQLVSPKSADFLGENRDENKL